MAAGATASKIAVAIIQVFRIVSTSAWEMGHKLPLAQITIFRTPCKVYVEVENGFSLDAESGVEEEKEILHSAAHGRL
jgi:hypothetical protein